MKKPVLIALICLLFAVEGYAQSLTIDDVSVSSSNLTFNWSHVTNRYILDRCTNLLEGEWEYVGDVVSTNLTTYSNDVDAAFYRVRKVRVVEFPDANLAAEVRSAIGRKFKPDGEIYDLDVASVTNYVWCEGASFYDSTGVRYLTNLATLAFFKTSITNLDVSGSVSLEWVVCGHTNGWNSNLPLVSLDVSDCPNLTNLLCRGNTRLVSADLSGCPSLQVLDCSWSGFTNLLTSEWADLRILECAGNHLVGLDLSQNPKLESLFAVDCNLSDLDLTANGNLVWLSCDNNRLANTLDLSINTNLTYISVTNNLLSEIIVWDTNDLPRNFLYDPGVIIREP